MKVHLRTLGCRLNESEIEFIARQLAQQGYEITDQADAADLFIVNTCAVTQEATRSSRQLVYRLHRNNPNASMAVTGCYAHIAQQAVAKLPGVTWVVDNFDKTNLVSIVTGQPIDEPTKHDREPITREVIVGAGGRTRAFVKVQDGCDRHCSFCVTKIARGPGRSRDQREIIAEIQALASVGYQEAVLTGVHLGSYGHDQGQPDGLYQLLQAILTETDIPRVRLSSLEPWGISAHFFELWQDDRLGKHLHLPLQSGCDATLRRMIRRTSQQEFRAIMAEARRCIPNVSITTDIIVGFPGETDAEFEISRQFIADMEFAGLHIFRYSARPGTAAIRLPQQVDDAVKKERMVILQAMHEQAQQHFAAQYQGQQRPVLWEAISGATQAGFINNGYTDNFIRVRHIWPQVLTDQITMLSLGQWDAQYHAINGQALPL